MKKIIAILMVMILNITSITVKAKDFSVAEAVEGFKLINNPEAYTDVVNASERYVQRQIQRELDRDYPDHNMTKEEYIKLIKSQCVLTPEKIYYFNDLDTTKYSKQYAESGNFEYLINPTKFWALSYNNQAECGVFSENDYNTRQTYRYLMDNEGLNFLMDSEAVSKLVAEEIDDKILDCKLVNIVMATILYLKGEKADYGIKIYSLKAYDDDKCNLEKFKGYKMSELMASLGSYEQYSVEGVFEEKPIYQTEAESLQSDGLLKGNDKGLDLLKPMTRIEATAMLVRAMGYEDSQTSDTSYFADIQSDNWGAKYANIAKDKGITTGVGNDMFAPNDTITASQFATLILRNMGENPDWQTAIDTFVERGLITSEQAGKMDLFTRGDMAKIIYEARQKNMF